MFKRARKSTFLQANRVVCLQEPLPSQDSPWNHQSLGYSNINNKENKEKIRILKLQREQKLSSSMGTHNKRRNKVKLKPRHHQDPTTPQDARQVQIGAGVGVFGQDTVPKTPP